MLTTDFVTGAPNWTDLGAPDVEAAAAFYHALFGWEFQSGGPEAGGYGFFQLDGKTVAAAGPLRDPDAKPAWTLYFHTTDTDATARAVEQAGGTVRMAPTDVFTHGRTAAFTDPTGAEFAVWQPRDTGGLEAVTAVNTLCWTELYTTDAAAAKAFYGAVFGWQVTDTPMPVGTYMVIAPAGGGERRSQGGMVQLAEENLAAGSTSEWHPYFEVADCDATVAAATERGASVLIPAQDAMGVGRFAMFTDPAGAPVAVIASAPS